MKIVTKINGVDTVFIQSIDMQKINELSLLGASYNIPASIWGHAYLDNPDIINNPSKNYDYIKFTEPHELDFFEQNELSFILNYNDLYKLSPEQLKQKITDCYKKIAILKHYNAVEYQIAQIKYSLNTFKYILNLKENNQEIPIPKEIITPVHEITGFQKFINRFTQK